MLSLEVLGMYLIVRLLTYIKADKKRWYIATILLYIFILIMDIFVFKYHKSTGRSLVLLSLFIVYFKFMFEIPWLKAAKQLLILFVVLLMADLSVLLLVRGLSIDSLEWLYGNFAFMYAIYLGILYLYIAIISIMNIERFKIN